MIPVKWKNISDLSLKHSGFLFDVESHDVEVCLCLETPQCCDSNLINLDDQRTPLMEIAHQGARTFVVGGGGRPLTPVTLTRSFADLLHCDVRKIGRNIL